MQNVTNGLNIDLVKQNKKKIVKNERKKRFIINDAVDVDFYK